MNILLVSQCKKNALKETRRIIDLFAERCGERTWQTAITQDGLTTLYKLLRKTARKNTAIACYWTHGKNHTELLWIVGDRTQFNEQGRVPTNRTKRNILRSDSENSWQYGTSIQIVATIAALLHDLGKATIAFQDKLKKAAAVGDPYRHEWISLKLFILMVEGCDNNQAVLTRLAHFEQYQNTYQQWYNALSSIDKNKCDLSKKPSLVQWIAWLIVSHHRMPICQEDEKWDKRKNKSIQLDLKKQRKDSDYIEDFTPKCFFKELAAFSGWVWNPLSEHPNPQHFWQLTQTVTTSKTWLSQLKRWANKGLNHPNLMSLTQALFITDPFLLHLSRLALMTGDHNFSSQPKKDNKHIAIDELIANTDSNRQAKQHLDEHLIGVAQYTARFARLLPIMPQHLPHLPKHKSFTQRTTIKRFMWQNHAFDLVKSAQTEADEAGFFGVNMASTGCGKTLANGRIMYALSNPKNGTRFTIALGLRVLTLQTGKALRERLNLTDEQLAILVGGQANQTLFELAQKNEQSYGSDSIEPLIDGFVDVAESGIDKDEFGTIISDNKARSLLFTPLITCTVDHLIQACENQRGGKHIAPMLRLLTSDLILDEPDDFDQGDLPALARLVHLAGLFGSKVLLSSATLTPDLIAGLFDAYQSGRKIWQKQQQKADLPIVCGWFDEFNQQIATISSQNNFIEQHAHFVSKRVGQLANASIRRQAEIMPLMDYQTNKIENSPFNFSTMADQLVQQAYQLHSYHYSIDPKTNKKISIGLIRLAHTENVIAITKAIYQLNNIPTDTQLHVVVYHAKQLLLLRSKLEEKLDRLLSRNESNQLFEQAEIRQTLDHNSATNHLFIVIGTPVTEVGRDHDYDWAIVEPSSMRSIVQLAGRVWRHRPNKVANNPNIAIIGSNLAAIKKGNLLGIGEDSFCRPGFESREFLLTTHKADELITESQRQNINAIPRIEKSDNRHEHIHTLSTLEHCVMADLFNLAEPNPKNKKSSRRQSNEVTSYWQNTLAHPYCVHLQRITPFRKRERKQIEYVCQFDENSKHGLHFSEAESAWQTPNELSETSQNKTLCYDDSWQRLIEHNSWVKPWLTNDFYQELTCLSEHFPDKTLHYLALQFATVTLTAESQWHYHPWFGFYFT